MRRGGLFTGKGLVRGLLILGLAALAAALLIGKNIHQDLRPLPTGLRPQGLEFRKQQFLDRNGIALSVTYDNPWNVHDWLTLHEIPAFLQAAFIASEDRRFYRHHGVDWLARVHALVQNLAALRSVRGASTITEQVVRILHPRPRTLRSRLLEGIEAARLEKRFSKPEILEFYLNQVPYGRQRRGVLQAARLYFDRDLDTLSQSEMLALAVLVRAPDRLGRQGGNDLVRPLRQLSRVLVRSGKMTETASEKISAASLPPAEFHLPVDASHFLRQFGRVQANHGPAKILTTLDSTLQGHIQDILDQHLRDLKNLDVHNGAVLVVNHQTDEVLAWVNNGGLNEKSPGGWIDAVTAPRQPGSTLKPFLYGLALERSWTASTIIDDSPLSRPVGNGMHPFRNYSRSYHGPLRLREALGNSLNIPAIRAIRFTGAGDFLDRLHDLGFAGLNRSARHYGEGLALGNGEVTLLELVQAYNVLARGGVYHPLRFSLEGRSHGQARRRIYSSETASLVVDILADPESRRLEFGNSNIFSFPVQTAVKTGTSNDHRDAWAVGVNHLFTVGVWMGNLDGHATGGLTGTQGPGLVLRSAFTELNRFEEARRLFLSPLLAVEKICRKTGFLATPLCPTVLEKYLPGTIPHTFCDHHSGLTRRDPDSTDMANSPAIHFLQPSANLQMIMDPHIPDSIEAYPMRLTGHNRTKRVEWLVDGQVAGITGENQVHFMWPLSRGSHQAQARVWLAESGSPLETPPVRFLVK
ncbi:MAG: hypothetical protein VR65_12410 [Desulfobulbaceae bacterium BRH_c16a]|nr:MAG: hypothetical protein VR65_12410 [Desulfobulbaceae bacterium BRH_c16a]